MEEAAKIKRARDMIKHGDMLKGFRFEHMTNSAGLAWDGEMEQYVGVEGRAQEIFAELVLIDFYDGRRVYWYPMAECLENIREDKLKDLGI